MTDIIVLVLYCI